MTPRTIGRIAEELVMSILPDAEYHNKTVDSLLPYDISWERELVHIDVKATTKAPKNIAHFSIKVEPRHTSIILVLVYLQEGTTRNPLFWVERYSDQVRTNYKLTDATTIDKLISKLKEVKKQPIPEITTARRSSRQLTISTKQYNSLDDARQRIAKEVGTLLSPQSAIDYLVNFYINNV